MYVPILLFLIAIVLILIFWELSKIHTLLKKMLVPSHDITKDDKHAQTQEIDTQTR